MPDSRVSRSKSHKEEESLPKYSGEERDEFSDTFMAFCSLLMESSLHESIEKDRRLNFDDRHKAMRADMQEAWELTGEFYELLATRFNGPSETIVDRRKKR